MADLQTTYMGIKLKNPLIVASSTLTSNLDKIVKCEQAGAGAVILKSLFEEQINIDRAKMLEGASDMGYADGYDFFMGYGKSHFLDDYVELVMQAKERVSIPVIPSVNCVTGGEWIEYAERFESVGADGLELNTFVIPSDVSKNASYFEEIYLDLARKIKKQVKIPVAMKVSPHFTDMAGFVKKLADIGIDGIVMFNRFYRPDVDIDNLIMKHAPILSSPQEIYLALQWIALLSGEIESDFCATTGVWDGEGLIKQLLVGAKSIQMCSALIKNGLHIIPEILSELEGWMDKKGFSSIADFNGKLCQESSDNPEIYERNQYIKAVVGIE
ncbi:MAG: dihydroorotate dehydrogenase-like protein [Spirochaetales bacterium]|nr:dihydroorotate dehydrogenase-like protein [Spirochaetales bacterium]